MPGGGHTQSGLHLTRAGPGGVQVNPLVKVAWTFHFSPDPLNTKHKAVGEVSRLHLVSSQPCGPAGPSKGTEWQWRVSMRDPHLDF